MGLKDDARATVETLTRENAALRNEIGAANRRMEGLRRALDDAQENIGKLQSLRAAARDMREAQKYYFANRKKGATKHESVRLERAYDKLDERIDDPQRTLFPEVDPEVSAKCQKKPPVQPMAHVIPKGPNIEKLVSLKTIILARPVGCAAHVQSRPDEYRSLSENRVDAITWAKGAMDIVIAGGQAEDHDEAARKLVNGLLAREGMI